MQSVLLIATLIVSVGALLLYSFLLYKYYRIDKDEKQISAYYQSRTIRSSCLSDVGALLAINTFGDSINKALAPFVKVKMHAGANYSSIFFDNKNNFHNTDINKFSLNELAFMHKLGLLKKFNLSSYTEKLTPPNLLVAWYDSLGEIDGVYAEVVKSRCTITVIGSAINIFLVIWLYVRGYAALKNVFYKEDYIFLRSDFTDNSWLWLRRMLSALLNTILFIGCVATIYMPFFLYSRLFNPYDMNLLNSFFEFNFNMVFTVAAILIIYTLLAAIWWIMGENKVNNKYL